MRAEDFRRAYREGQRVAGVLANMYVRRTGLPVQRVGIAVSRKVGPAVSRNRLRRRLREAYRQISVTETAGMDLVIVPRPAALQAPLTALQDSLRQMMMQAGLRSLPKAARNEGEPR